MTNTERSIVAFMIFLLGISIFLSAGEIQSNKKQIKSLDMRVDSLKTEIHQLQQDSIHSYVDSLQTRVYHLEIWNEIFAEYYPWIAKEIKTRTEQIREDEIPAE